MYWLDGEEKVAVRGGSCGSRSIHVENDADKLASNNMRLYLSCVYWMLLLISVLSSTLLFLLVASENPQNKFIGPDRHQSVMQDGNSSVNHDPLEQFGLGSMPRLKIPSSLKPKLKEQDFESAFSASFNGIDKSDEFKVPEEIEILKESLIQQPNLSQEISEGGQAVVVTLVDTATALQDIAADRADFRPKQQQQAEGNASESRSRLSQQQLLDANTTSDDAALLNDDSVVVVRAEQKSFSIDDDVAESSVTLERQQLLEENSGSAQVPTTAPDLNDSAARARLTNDDGSAAAILDGLVTAGPTEPHEEIPSFNEWAQKRLEEAEKKKSEFKRVVSHPNASVQTASGSPGRGLGSMRMRSKNYASPDCGAKVVGANPESSGVRNILVSTRDEYMLNACTSRVWFVVELCEAIQAKKIELANFELFSSSPKDIAVYVSDRFPTREWSNVGHFTARDERDVQSFNLQPHLFGKFIKIELLSHYGSEHFCPISLFRVYGTSEFEVLETETEHVDENRSEINPEAIDATGSNIASEDDDDEPMFVDEDENNIDQPSHIFGSARDAVLSIVKKATSVLVKSEDLKPTNNITKIQENIRGDVLEDETLDDCTTPIYNVACHDCDDDRFARVFQLISCKRHYLESLLNTDFVLETLDKSHLCSSSSGFDFRFDDETCMDSNKALETRLSEVSKYYLQAQFLSSFFTPDYIIALCNVLAAREQRLFANTSHQEQQQQSNDKAPNDTEKDIQVPLRTKDEKVTSTRHAEVPIADTHRAKAEIPIIKSKLDSATESVSESLIVQSSFPAQIKPTKTTSLNVDDTKKRNVVINLESSKSHSSDDVTSETSFTPVPNDTKRTGSTSQKTNGRSQDHVQSPAVPQEKLTSREVPKPSKASTQNVDNIQKVGDKNVVNEVEAKSEVKEAEMKTKTEPVEQDVKAVPHDQLNFDGFDFDVDSLQGNGAGKNDASVTQQTASAATPQQKESVFLRLSNRIKILERNMSLSSQYLEELSRRYKKQVEEMQRSLERAVTAMTEESRKGEERENKRVEEVAALRNQIENLTKILDDLVYERNSWRFNLSSLMQNSLIVVVDVVLVILIISYCKRTDDNDYYDVSVEDSDGVVIRPKTINKAYETIKQNCKQLLKKPKKRRPSEIAAQVTGTYEQLMIEDGVQLSKKDRRKRRKRETVVVKSSIKEGDKELKLPSRSASVGDALYALSQNNENYNSKMHNRTDSAPDSAITYFHNDESYQPQQDKRVQILTIDVSNGESTKTDEECSNRGLNTSFSYDDDAYESTGNSSTSFHFKAKKLSSPSFMKTALVSRSKRISFSGSAKKQTGCLNDGDNNLTTLGIANGRTTNGLTEESDESRASSATPSSWHKKEKKTNGLKKMNRQQMS
ncbi:SUN domain-containing ossification factor [Phymastichus coffea]|uniref:SUN domain-containing ossification factor n=1 Tax=Phymastichus coffea TaxID=108790 RepID=UPI00273C3515|nr:SUN domain-containing ossification factor [Phymastichus coffea]